MTNSIFLLFLLAVVFVTEFSCLTMLGLTRGKNGNSGGEPLYFPEEDDAPKKHNKDPELDKTFVRVIGTVAGRQFIARRWDDDEPVNRTNIERVHVRQPPVISRILGRRGGLY